MAIPIVTALLVTRERVGLASDAVADYQRQTYPSRRLLVVTDGTDSEAAAFRSLAEADPTIRVVHAKGVYTLGELRNLSLDESSSDWTIQWDDDDWYHPERIAHQVEGIQDNRSAVLLREQLHYRRDTGELAWVSVDAGIDGTLLYDRRFGLRYPNLRRTEDAVLARELRERKQVTVVPGGIRYCRTFHGANTWDLAHHADRMRRLGLPASKLAAKWSDIVAASELYPWRPDWRCLQMPAPVKPKPPTRD